MDGSALREARGAAASTPAEGDGAAIAGMRSVVNTGTTSLLDVGGATHSMKSAGSSAGGGGSMPARTRDGGGEAVACEGH